MKPEIENNTIRLQGGINITRALELNSQLLEGLALSNEVEIDLSAVNEIDTAGVQLLIHAKKAADKAQRVLRLCRHSPAVLDVFELLNLGAYFGDPLVIQSQTGAAS